MIADWIYNFLVFCGYGFNQAVGIKDVSEVSNIKTAIMLLIIIIIFLIIIVILLCVEVSRKKGNEVEEDV